MKAKDLLEIEVEIVKLSMKAYENGNIKEEKRLLKLAKKLKDLRGGK